MEHWIVSNRLVLINTPTDPPTFYSRVWKTTSTPDIAIATDNIQKTAKREVSEQLGGSDHKPVILTLAKQVNTNAGKMPPSWNYKKADWKRFRELTDIYTKSITFSKHSVNKNASNFNSAVLKAAKESIPRGRRHDYKPYWNNTLEKIHKELSEAREEMERNPTQQNVRRHSQLKVDLDKEKQTQTQASWKTKTASLNMERETQKLWQLTKSLNGDNSERGRTTLNCFFSKWLLSPPLTLTRQNFFIFCTHHNHFFATIISIFSSFRIYNISIMPKCDLSTILWEPVTFVHVVISILSGNSLSEFIFEKSVLLANFHKSVLSTNLCTNTVKYWGVGRSADASTWLLPLDFLCTYSQI